MISRAEYYRQKEVKIAELEAEASDLSLRLEAAHEKLADLELETYEMFIGDAKYDSWKATRVEL